MQIPRNAATPYAEAFARCEEARADVERLRRALAKRTQSGGSATGIDVLEEQCARSSLFLARVRLAQLEPIGQPITD